MELYIRIKDGKPFEHPIIKENFQQAFPDIDVNNLPSDFAKFERKERPEIGLYQIYEGCTYELVGDTYRDIHHVREMTTDEASEIDKQLNEIMPLDSIPYIRVTRV